MRRLYYRDSYGRWHEDRRSESRRNENHSSVPARWVIIALVVLAAIVVLASLPHLPRT